MFFKQTISYEAVQINSFASIAHFLYALKTFSEGTERVYLEQMG